MIEVPFLPFVVCPESNFLIFFALTFNLVTAVNCLYRSEWQNRRRGKRCCLLLVLSLFRPSRPIISFIILFRLMKIISSRLHPLLSDENPEHYVSP